MCFTKVSQSASWSKVRAKKKFACLILFWNYACIPDDKFRDRMHNFKTEKWLGNILNIGLRHDASSAASAKRGLAPHCWQGIITVTGQTLTVFNCAFTGIQLAMYTAVSPRTAYPISNINPCHTGPVYIREIINIIMAPDASVQVGAVPSVAITVFYYCAV